jgi:S-adenosylmethionine synthetase
MERTRMSRYLFTSESVTEGHPDKVADQISDAVLDAVMAEDPQGRVACETLVTTGLCMISGEISTETYVEFQDVARGAIAAIGYNDPTTGFDSKTCCVMSTIDRQSGDIAMGVDRDGAGDQGLMFGYACRETPELMPLPIMLSHKLCKRLADLRHGGDLAYLRPDGKAQVTVAYENERPVAVTAVVVSTQHTEDATQKQIREDVIERIVKPIVPAEYLSDDTVYHVNPTGRFVIGGPHGDAGLTGRKIIVDTYGGMGRHGGGAFSGKDPTKVDRSACYMARKVAKNIVAAELAERCEVQLAYAIGVAEPVSVRVMTQGTGAIPEEQLEKAVREVFPLTPKGIIEALGLRAPIYRKTAAYGHFGRENEGFRWEDVDKVDALKKACG